MPASDHSQAQLSGSRTRWLTLALTLVVCSACTAATPDVEKTVTVPSMPMPSSLTKPEQDCSHPGDDTLTSVVRVASAEGADASGVVIAPDRVLTAAHVVEDFIYARVFINGAYRDARVVARDKNNDLALLWTETDDLRPIRISSSHLFSAEPVWTVGFPLAREQTANFGRYQQLIDGAIHSTAGTNAGASGGGLLRCTHGAFELAGMIRGYGAYWQAGELRRVEDLSISVPAATIASFASSAGVGLQ